MPDRTAARPRRARDVPGTRRSTAMGMVHPRAHGQVKAATWRRGLFPAAAMASLVTQLARSGSAPHGLPLTYTQFAADVGAGTVRAVTIGPAGQVTGSLAGGEPFTTTIPGRLRGNRLATDRAPHPLQVSATTRMSSPPLSGPLGLPPPAL